MPDRRCVQSECYVSLRRCCGDAVLAVNVPPLRQEKYTAIEKLIVQDGIKHGGEAFTLFGCAIARAMGTSLSAKVLPPVAKGWACHELQQQFLGAIPAPVRAIMGPKWARKYKSYLECIQAVGAAETEPVPVSEGCRCSVM